jgi:chromosome segregation ATPase
VTKSKGAAEKLAKQLESQLSDANAKLDESSRNINELSSAKSKNQTEAADLGRQLEEAESQLSQLTKAKQALQKQLEEAKAALE